MITVRIEPSEEHVGIAVEDDGTGLPDGDYAVSAFLDENANMKLDANLFGLPTEPYGFSRDARALAGPPAFADAAIRLDASTARQTITLK